jgi:hypothetical protein
MRSIFLAPLLCFIVCTLQAQRVSLPPFVVARGIYTSFTSIRNSVPNRNDSFQLVTRSTTDIVLVGGSETGFKLDSASKDEWKALRKVLVGISDGKQFYISDRYTVGGWFGLSPCYLKGPLIVVLNGRGNLAQYTGGGLLPALIGINENYVINIRSRERAKLDKSYLKVLMKPYPDIVEKYKKMNLMDNSINIIEEINDRMTVVGPDPIPAK